MTRVQSELSSALATCRLQTTLIGNRHEPAPSLGELLRCNNRRNARFHPRHLADDGAYRAYGTAAAAGEVVRRKRRHAVFRVNR